MLKKYDLYIGIDTGIATGFATWDRPGRRLTFVGAVKIHVAMDFIREAQLLQPAKIFVRVEDARKRKWIPSYGSESRERGRREGAGYVKRDAIIWEDFLTSLGIDFEMVAPRNNKTKLTAAAFQKITGWRPITNGHGRDAAMLVYGY